MDFQRKNIRLPHSNYLGHQWYFLTTCTESRLPVLHNSALVTEHLDVLRHCAQAQAFDLQAYCFMPDHLHLLVSGALDTSDCMEFICGFKQRSAFTFKKSTGKKLWQHKPYDRILRRDERWEGVAYYIWMNPVRKGLCARPEEWPYSGSWTMDWKLRLTPPKELWEPPWKRSRKSE